ncbi:MAG: pyridoxamine 5'-phosphate oxidase family protein [Acidimicrobiia bacterium]
MDQPRSARTTVKREALRAEYERDRILAIIDAGLVAHVGVNTPDGPIVLPMAYGRDATHIYLHGSVANSMLRHAQGAEVCVTITLLDGLVIARSAFNNSMNYRSVVIRGCADVVEGPAHLEALRVISNHIIQNWEYMRPPTPKEIAQTLVLAVPLDECSAKVRAGDPVDEPEDLDGPWWSGTIPLIAHWGTPAAAADLAEGIAPPTPVTGLAGRATR